MTSHSQGEPWFEDGNLILLTEDNTTFRIHRGVLARQSEVFRSMLDFPQPAADSDVGKLEQCPVVHMYDHSHELSNLLRAIYDGITFQNRSINDFFLLAGILRLSTKYFITHLRSSAITHLTRAWPYTLKGHDTMVDLALSSPIIDQMSYPYVHPLHILNLAREVNLRIIVPSALYFLSTYPFSELLRADHPKLLVENPSKPSSELSRGDLEAYNLMFQHRIDLFLDFSRRFCDKTHVSSQCTNGRLPCIHAVSRLSLRMSRSWEARTGPLHWMLQAVQKLYNDATICAPCKNSFKVAVHAHREALWDALPGIVGLPAWETLVESDLPPDSR